MNQKKKKQMRITSVVWNFFQPIHEHLGSENSATIDEITKYVIKKLELTPSIDGLMILKIRISSRIFGTLMKQSSKYYIKGLGWETTGDRIGHYYIVKSIEESKRISRHCQQLITQRITKKNSREIEYSEYLVQLDYKPNCGLLEDNLISKERVKA